MAAGRRGRPYQVPEDHTPIGGDSIDIDARVGWLLLMSRLHHPDPDLALGECFNAALRKVGLQADRSAVSRWESGKVTPRYSVLVAYEQALGLRVGQLTSVVNAQRRAFGGEGLSGTGPKAGGPRYLPRFGTGRVLAINTAGTGGKGAFVSLQDEE